MEVEDHPLDYGDFEGTIPKGEYGGGTVMLWDRGYWAPEKGFEKIGSALAKGELKFVMEGERMHGSWVIVRTKRDDRGKAELDADQASRRGAVDGNAGGPTDDDSLDRFRPNHGRDRQRQGTGGQAVHDRGGRGRRRGLAEQSATTAPSGLHRADQGKSGRAKTKTVSPPAGLHRAAADASRWRNRPRARLGARDQVRRLPHAAAHPGRARRRF